MNAYVNICPHYLQYYNNRNQVLLFANVLLHCQCISHTIELAPLTPSRPFLTTTLHLQIKRL